MIDRLALPRRYRDRLEALLREHVPDAEVWAYGSRVNGRSHDGSDLDLVLRGPGLEPLSYEYLELVEALEQSNIPILVQAHDWARLPESFHREIERDYVTIQRGAETGEWQSMPFSEAVIVNPPVRLQRGTEYPFVDMAAVDPGIRWARAESQRKHSGGGSRFQDGDTLMARITPCLENGKTARYRAFDDMAVAHGSTEFIIIRGRPGVTDDEFAYYLTQSPAVREYAISQMTGTSGRQRVPTTALDHIDVALPPLPEQRRIAHVLGALDDKIELNRRMNETLEAMARAIFQDWFVDFGPVRAKLEGREPYLPPELWALFPNRLVDSELGEIPEGWAVKALGEVVDVVGGTTPSTKKSEFWEGGTHCWATPKDLSLLYSPVLLDTGRKITDAGLDRIPSGLLPAGTLLLSSRAPIGYLAICQMPVAINQGFIAIPTGLAVSNLYMLHWCKAFHDEIVNHANGSTFLEISKSNFRQIRLAVPNGRILDQFDNRARSLYERIVANERETLDLAAQRDALLPRLVSGELRVSG